MRSDKVRKNIYISKAAWDRLAAAVGPRGVSQAIEDAVIKAAAEAEHKNKNIVIKISPPENTCRVVVVEGCLRTER